MTLADLLAETKWSTMDVCEALESAYWSLCDKRGSERLFVGVLYNTLCAYSNLKLCTAEARAAIIAYE